MTGQPAGWYPGPGVDDEPDTAGQVLRWWTGAAWGPQVAEVGTRPDPPPGWYLDDPTAVLDLPPTSTL